MPYKALFPVHGPLSPPHVVRAHRIVPLSCMKTHLHGGGL